MFTQRARSLSLRSLEVGAAGLSMSHDWPVILTAEYPQMVLPTVITYPCLPFPSLFPHSLDILSLLHSGLGQISVQLSTSLEFGSFLVCVCGLSMSLSS